MVRTELPSNRYSPLVDVPRQPRRFSKLAFTDGERDAAQGMHGFVPYLEVAFDILKFNDCFIHNSFLCIIFRSSSYFPEGQA